MNYRQATRLRAGRGMVLSKSNVLIWISLLVFIVLSVMCVAQSTAAIQRINISEELNEDASARQSMRIEFAGGSASNAIELPLNIRDVVVNGVPTTVSGSRVVLDCNICNVTFTLDKAMSVVQGQYVFEQTISYLVSQGGLDYRVVLPAGYFVLGTGTPIIPMPSTLSTDGSHIVVQWLAHEAPHTFRIEFSPEESTDEVSLTEEFSEWQIWVAAGIATLVGLLGGVLIARRFRSVATVLPKSVFTPDEQTVLELIKKSPKVTQKEVGRTLGWSKSKASAIISGLERKQVIVREQFGRNYKLVVIKPFE